MSEAADTARPAATLGDTPAEHGSSGAPSYDDIAHAAYLRYLNRGGDHGREVEDWLEAERELRSKR